MTDPDPITIAARALVRACADSSEEFEIDWHKPAVREREMRCVRAAFAALKADGFEVKRVTVRKHVPLPFEDD